MRAQPSQNLRARDNDQRPGTVAPRANACVNASISWPSTSATRQPNARHLSANGSSVVTEVTGPSTCELLASITTDEPAQAPVRGEHRRLPYLALFHLAIAEKRESVAILAGKLGREREPDCAGKPLPQRAANQIAERRAFAADRFEQRAVLAVSRERLRIEQAELRLRLHKAR